MIPRIIIPPNDGDVALYPEDTLFLKRPKVVAIDPASGIVSTGALEGNAEGSISLAIAKGGAALVTVALTETTELGAYYGNATGPALAAAFTGVSDGSTIWQRTTFGSAASLEEPRIWRAQRSR